jgi:DNA-binding IclR family transcriptional regulator
VTCGLPRSSTYRLLTTLADRGFVSHLRESGRFGLGAAAYELGSAYRRQAPLQRIAAPLLARLVDATTHNAHLAVMHGRDVLYVVEERAAGRPRLVTDVGVRLPAELTASGLAMLAQLPAAQLRALYPAAAQLVRREEVGPRSLADLRRTLTQTRARGYAVESGTVTVGLASVAVAVRGPHRPSRRCRRGDLSRPSAVDAPGTGPIGRTGPTCGSRPVTARLRG